MRLVADIETNGLLRQANPVIHCLVTKDLDTVQINTYDDTGKNETVVTGVKYLELADEFWGHNWVGFDEQFIREVYPFYEPRGFAYDTLILSRLMMTDMLDRDLRSKRAGVPANLYGRHSLGRLA